MTSPGSNWHVVNLDSECQLVPGGCGAGSAQDLWLEADLAANSTKNVIAVWHKPRYSSGATNYQNMQPLWDDLYAAGVDILLDGHDHIYERTVPDEVGRDAGEPAGRRPDATGSASSRSAPAARRITGSAPPLPTSEVRNDTTFGILKLTLHATTYDWVFLPIAGAPSPTRAPVRSTPRRRPATRPGRGRRQLQHAAEHGPRAGRPRACSATTPTPTAIR